MTMLCTGQNLKYGNVRYISFDHNAHTIIYPAWINLPMLDNVLRVVNPKLPPTVLDIMSKTMFVANCD